MTNTITWGVIAASQPDPIDALPFNWTVVGNIVVPIVVAIVGAIALLASKRAQKGSRENAIIDQLQEQLDRADTRSDKQDTRMAVIESDIKVLRRVSQIRLNYIYVLRRHIDNNDPPPAPPWPNGIHD